MIVSHKEMDSVQFREKHFTGLHRLYESYTLEQERNCWRPVRFPEFAKAIAVLQKRGWCIKHKKKPTLPLRDWLDTEAEAACERNRINQEIEKSS